ncbi:MAG: hypothetical protein ACI4NA_00610, partial [Succinivibrio sp.]
GETLYVKGAMARMSLPGAVPRANIIDRGIRPPELDAIIRARGTSSNGDLCRIRFKERPPLCGEIGLNSVLEGSLRYDSHESAPLDAQGRTEPVFCGSPLHDDAGGRKEQAGKAGALEGGEACADQDGGAGFGFSEAGGITSAKALRASRTRQGLKALCAELLRSRR